MSTPSLPESHPNRHNHGGGMVFVLLAVAATLAVGAWLWACWCVFPTSAWNDLRLAPSLALLRGVTFYPPADSGAVTTWIYGPLPVLLWSPAALAGSPAGALLAAGIINLVPTLAAIAATAAFWPGQANGPQRFAAGLLAIAIWPFASFQFLQADNPAIAFALFANLLLATGTRPSHLWGAAVLTAAAVACKQTSLGIVVGQLAWLGVARGGRAALGHLGRGAAVGALLAAGAIVWFGWEGMWFNMLTVPGGLPWVPEVAVRVRETMPELLVHLALPAVVLVAARRRIFNRTSPLLLPSLTWCATLPLGLAAFLNFGGTLNSFQGFPLWLTAALVGAMEAGHGRAGTARRLAAGAAVAALFLAGWRCARLPVFPTAPATVHYQQADLLVREFPGRIWFPWHPLIAAYREDRFRHTEDGMYMRYLAGHPLTRGHTDAALPERMQVIALPRFGNHWGIALDLRPAGAQTQEFGYWTLHSWPVPP
jgi:hypothetical protein